MMETDMMYTLASVLNTTDLEEHERNFISRIYLGSDVKDALKVSRFVSRSNDENRDVIDEVISNETWGRICSLMGEEEFQKMWKHKFVMYQFTDNIKISLNGRLTLEDKPSSSGENKRNKGSHIIDLSRGYNPRTLVDRKVCVDRQMKCNRTVIPTNYESVCSLIQKQETGVSRENICNYITYKQSKMLRKFLTQNFSLDFFRKKLNTHSLQKNGSFIQIDSMVKAILESHVPRDLIGSKKAFDRMTRNICRVFATNPRYPLRLGVLMKGLPSLGFHGNVFLSKFVLFLTNVFVSRVVFQLFYRTESLKDKKVLFFKRRVWAKYEKNALEKMVDSGILAESSEVSYGPHVSKLRISHKTNGFRPLVTSSTRLKRIRFRLSVCNTFLKQIVNQINPAYGHVLNALHSQWSKIKPSKSDKLFFIRTDVSEAFQSILHLKLVEILNRRVSNMDPVQTCRTFEYRCGSRKKSVLQFTKIMPRLSKKTLFCEAGKKVYTTSYLKAVIIQYIKQNYVSLNGTKVFHQIKGLPQGCYLSSILCELYLADMDDCYFNHLKSENDVFVRGMDDYLYLTFDSQKADTFLKLINNGIVDYGITFQRTKTFTNFVGPATSFPFYGYKFYPLCRKVEPDFSEWEGDITARMYLSPKMTWNDLAKRMKMITHIKLHELIVDSDYLHKFAIMKNIYLCSKIHAAKYKAIHNFLTENGGGAPPSSTQCLLPIIAAARVIACKVISINNGVNDFSHREVKIVVLKAFESVLGPTGPFRSLVNLLRVTTGRMLTTKLSTRFKTLLKSLVKNN